ncbi:hypothetical protein, partial [Lactobacillus helveticus]
AKNYTLRLKGIDKNVNQNKKSAKYPNILADMVLYFCKRKQKKLVIRLEPCARTFDGFFKHL